MSLLSWIALAYLIVFVPIPLMWIIVHTTTSFWRKVGKWTYGLAIIVWILSAFFFTSYKENVLGMQHPFVILPFIAGIMALFLALYIETQQRRVFSLKTLIGFPEIMPKQYPGRLVTSGIYGKIRHPRYVSYILLGWSLAFLTRYVGGYVFAILLAFSFYIIMILEERELQKRFGRAYEDYMRKVPRLWPRR